MSAGFLDPSDPVASRAGVFVRYLDWLRSGVIERVENLPAEELRSSRLPTGWTPVELVKHLTFVELRWIEWGFQGREVADPWGDRLGDRHDKRWYVAPDESLEALIAALRAQGDHTRAAIESTDLAATGQPGPRWGGADPATLERVLFHLVQEYARRLGHLDIVVELAGGPIGE